LKKHAKRGWKITFRIFYEEAYRKGADNDDSFNIPTLTFSLTMLTFSIL
jgi:hypothetical protein